MQTLNWSEALQDFTRDTLYFRNDFVPMRDEIYFKRFSGGHAMMTLEDYAQQKPLLTDFQGNAYAFENIEALVEAGWALD